MDHGIRFDLCNCFSDHFLIRNIEADIRHPGYGRIICYSRVLFCKIRTDTFIASFIQFIHNVVTQLTINAGNKKLHPLHFLSIYASKLPNVRSLLLSYTLSRNTSDNFRWSHYSSSLHVQDTSR